MVKIEKRFVTRGQVAEQQRGSTRVAPGLWIDREGGLHFSIPELLVVCGFPDDPEHRAIVEQAIREHISEQFPETTCVYQVEES